MNACTEKAALLVGLQRMQSERTAIFAADQDAYYWEQVRLQFKYDAGYIWVLQGVVGCDGCLMYKSSRALGPLLQSCCMFCGTDHSRPLCRSASAPHKHLQNLAENQVIRVYACSNDIRAGGLPPHQAAVVGGAAGRAGGVCAGRLPPL